jgi:hypothetical protein
MGACDEIPEDEADPPSYRLHLNTTAIDVQIPPSSLQGAWFFWKLGQLNSSEWTLHFEKFNQEEAQNIQGQ